MYAFLNHATKYIKPFFFYLSPTVEKANTHGIKISIFAFSPLIPKKNLLRCRDREAFKWAHWMGESAYVTRASF